MSKASIPNKPKQLEVTLQHVKDYGVISALITADLCYWLISLDYPQRWYKNEWWANMFCVSNDTIKRQRPNLEKIFIIDRKNRTGNNGQHRRGTNSYSLDEWRKSQLIQQKKKTKQSSETYQINDSVVFPLEFIQLAIKYNDGVNKVDYSWFLFRISRLIYKHEREFSRSSIVKFKSMAWLAGYCQLSKRTLERYSEHSRLFGLVILDGSITAHTALKHELLLPLILLDEARTNGLSNAIQDDQIRPYKLDWAESELYALRYAE